ncbi:TolC family protein [Pleurocapsa sp. FMAR1]|uniref:TolC family protein n=1 Tax=Pleurocapsa sp. FMAR1 TaxID=3040204 RepID=UPI0029C8778B|nr:TolC family protein [Pleurocapsa sp. FMAR1]
MGKINQFIKIIGIGSVILVTNAAIASAQNIASHDSSNSVGKNLTANQKKNIVSNSKLPSSVLPEKNSQLSNSDAVFQELTSGRVAQSSGSTSDATADIIKPAQKPILNLDQLNPSPNPLSFPTKPIEVKVDTQKPITLEQAIELSLKNNKQIEEERIQVERSQAVVRQAKAALFPTATFSTGFSYGNSVFLDSINNQVINQRVNDAPPGTTRQQVENQLSQNSISGNNFSNQTASYNTDVSLNYNIYDGGNRGASIRAAEKQLRSTRLNLEVVVEQARFETARDYYNLQNGDAQVKIEQAAVADARQTLKDARLLEKAGLGTRFDVLRAEVELAQAQQRLITAQANQNIARRQLAETLSVSHSTGLATADPIAEAGAWKLSLPQSIVQAFKNRAELEQFLLQREISAEQRQIALSQIRPTVGATAQYQISDDFEDSFNPSDNYAVGLNISWRFFDGGAARASALQSEKDIEIAQTQFADQRNLIRFAVEQAYFGLKSNQKNIGTATKQVQLSEESLRLARLRFQAGVGTQTDVIDAQTQLTTSRGDLLSSIIDYNQSYAQLQRGVSNTPDNGLQDLP